MNFRMIFLSIATALIAASCGGNTAPPGLTDNVPISATDGGTNPGPVLASPVGNPHTGNVIQVNRIDGDAPPKDAHFTIFCENIHGPDHIARIIQLRSDLMQGTGLRTWHIIHSEDASSLFFGYYRTYDDAEHDPREVARAKADLQKINSLKNAEGDRVFRACWFVPIDEPDPEAPHDWNLANSPPNAYWSLQIAAYRGGPERKELAVDAVRTLRTQLHVDAYYFHGESISSVCVGAWPVDAVKRQDNDEVHTPDGTIPIYVHGQLPHVIPEMHNREGQALTLIAPKLVVLDHSMANAIHTFPDHSINGVTYGKQGKDGQWIKDESFLVTIPGREHLLQDPIDVSEKPESKYDPVPKNVDPAVNAIIDDVPAGYGKLPSITH